MLADKYRQQGKPENVIEKIVEFGLKTYHKEVCLPEQAFIHDEKGKSVAQAVKEAEGKIGGPVKIAGLCAMLRRGNLKAGIRFRSRSLAQRPAGKEAAGRAGNGSISRSWPGQESDRIMAEPVYRRVVIKLSGEYLAGSQSFGIDQPTVDRIADELIAARQLGVEVAVVVGGGNIVRGVEFRAACRVRPPTPWACWPP